MSPPDGVIVQSLWVGSSLSPLQQLSIRSFLANGHPFHLYAYEDIEGVPDGTTLCDGRTVLPRDSIFCYQDGFGKGSYSAFSNVFRYKLLLDSGGWWVDTDLVCLRPFSLTQSHVFARERDDDGTVNCATCAIKTPPGSPVVAFCLESALARDKATLQWGQIGPQLLTAAVHAHQMTDHCVPVETFNPIDFFEVERLLEPTFDMSQLSSSYAVHCWNQMWRARGIDPAATVPADSLYGILQSRYPEPVSRSGSVV